jgi:hypothetical protein
MAKRIKPKQKKPARIAPVSKGSPSVPTNGLEFLNRPAISPEELYRLNLMPVSRNGIYDACNRGEIECFRLGRKIIIPTAALRRKLGMEAI